MHNDLDVRILIVEDDANKLGKVSRTLEEVVGLGADAIETATDLFTARALLQRNYYDLLVLDVTLPVRANTEPRDEAGVWLLREIVANRPGLRRPGHIVGLTAHADILERVRAQFNDESFVLLRYDPATDSWEHHLQARLRHILAVKRARVVPAESHSSFLFVLCALQSELGHVLDIPWNWENPPLSGDKTAYHHGTLRARGGGFLDIYAAAAPRMGMVHTAVLASKAIEAFRPKYIAMTGMTAGVRGKVELGQVLAFDPVWDYNSGKWTTSDGKSSFAPDPYQLNLDAGLRDHLLRLSTRSDLMHEIRNRWPGAKPPFELALAVGPVASGASVIADQGTVSRASAAQRKLLGLEMETFGLFVAAAEARTPRPLAFAMKSVVDFADPEKSDDYQPYGSFVSAQLLRSFVEDHLLPVDA